MSRRLALTALASVLILSTADLPSALAFGHGGGAGFHGGLRGGGWHGGAIRGNHAPGGYFGVRIPRGPGHPGIVHVPVRGPGKPPVVVGWPGWHHHHWHYRPGYYWVDGRYTYVTGPGVVTTSAVGGTCSCLTKSYLQDGTVVFTDQCTNESATAAPATATPNG
jgi:hypothetical protein